MSLKARITDDMKAALRARESARLSALRLLLAAVKQREIDDRIELDDAAIAMVVDKLIKQRRDSVEQYTAGHRLDLADAERFEIEVLSVYLPQQLGGDEIATLIKAALAETGATTAKDMGKVMAWLKPRMAGRADMTAVSAQVKAALA
jgi:uncharacterized protein YqeY